MFTGNVFTLALPGYKGVFVDMVVQILYTHNEHLSFIHLGITEQMLQVVCVKRTMTIDHPSEYPE